MKGLVRRVRAGAEVYNRQLTIAGLPFPRQRYKICDWCWEPVDEPRKRYWHSHCSIWSGASKCQLSPYSAHRGRNIPFTTSEPEWSIFWKDYHQFLRCVVCGVHDSDLDKRAYQRMEIEHELAISVAVELGRAAIIRAFMPDNLRYLCSNCHKTKTALDRVLVKALRDGRKPLAPYTPQLRMI